nr:hypothetical protein [Candidatus Bathyarchaeota archaeon]
MKVAEKAKERQRGNNQLSLEGELYACIATLDMLSSSYENGLIDAITYQKQLEWHIKQIINVRSKLESKGFDLKKFLEENGILEKYPYASSRLRLAASDGVTVRSEDEIPMEALRVSPSALASRTADVISNLITLIDSLQLTDYARIDIIVPLLDELALQLEKFPGLEGENYWVYKEVVDWRNRLKDLPPDLVLDQEDAKKMEYDAYRWYRDFKQRLKDLSL